MTYTWIDYLIIIMIALSMVTGLKRGFIKEAIALITLIAAFVVAITFAGSFANWLSHFDFMKSVVNSLNNALGEANVSDALSLIMLGLSFFILFILTVIVGSILKNIVSGIAIIPGVGVINRLFGVAFGVVRGLLICVAILFLFSLTSIAQSDAWSQSRIKPVFQSSILWLSNVMGPSIEKIKSKLGDAVGNVNGAGIYHNSGSE